MSETSPTPIPVTEAQTTDQQELEAAQQAQLHEQDPLRIVVSDVSDSARDRASDLADARWNKEVVAESIEPLQFDETGAKRLIGKAWNLGRAVKHKVVQAVKHPSATAKRTWKRTFDGYYRHKYREEAFNDIIASDNYFVGVEGGKEATQQMKESVAERLAHKDAERMLSTQTGEQLERLDSQGTEAAVEVHRELVGLAGKIATGELTEENFTEEANRTLKELAEQHPEIMGKGKMFADNLLKVALNVARSVDHLEGEARLDKLDETLNSIETYTGKASLGARSEVKYTNTDKFIKAIDGTILGRIGPAATIIAASVAAGKAVAYKGVARAAAMTGVFGAGAGVIAGMRKSKEVKEDRTQHARDRAVGQEFAAHAARRNRLETTRYETVAAQDLSSGLQVLFEGEGSQLKQLKELTPQGFLNAVATLAQIKTRNNLSDERNIDLIHFSDVTKVEEERFDLLQTEVYAEAALRKMLEENGGTEWLSDVGLTDEIQDFDQLLETLNEATQASIDQDISDKDHAFASLRRKEVAQAAFYGAVLGAGVGAIAQEITAATPGAGNNLSGVFEGNAGDGERTTLLGGIFGKEAGGSSTDNVIELGGSVRLAETDAFTPHQNPDGSWILEQNGTDRNVSIELGNDGLMTPETVQNLRELGFDIDSDFITPELSGMTHVVTVGNSAFTLPEEYSVQEVAPGNWAVVGSGQEVIHTLLLNPDGSITDEGIAQLQAGGINAITQQNVVEEVATVQVNSADEIIQNHWADTKQISRGWYDNDTPSPIYDLNEQGLSAGGGYNGWFDEQGNVVLDISRMTPDGSFHRGRSVNPFEATEAGYLSLAVSASKETQSRVFEFAFGTTPEGRTIATIPPEHPMHQFFAMDGKRQIFRGGFIEVMENSGEYNAKGSEKVMMLATIPGDNSAESVTDTIVTTKTVYETTLDIPPVPEHVETITYEVPPAVEAAPVIPLYVRRGLESPAESPQRIRYEYYQYGPQTPEEINELIQDTIPVLRNDPRARVSTGEATNWYDSLVRQRQGEEYVDDITNQINGSPELASLDSRTKAIVTIPVAALTEGNNIFETLSLYAQQSADDQRSTQILLHVNWPEASGATKEAQESIDHTLAEIERARAAFPGLRIATMQSQWTQQQVNGGVIGHVVRKMYDTAILAAKKAVDEGRMDSEHELVIIRNDADAKGIAPEYVSRMVDAVTQDDTDVAAGRIRWGIDQAKDLPGLALTMQIYEGIRGSAERARAKGIDASIETIGINTGMRLSTLAAVGSIGFSSYTGAGSDDLTVGARINAIRRSSSPVQQEIYRRRSGGRLRGWLSQPSLGRTTYEQVPSNTHDDSTVVIASGATIDSDISRLEGQYRRGEPVTGAWGNYDEGGYRPRTASLPSSLGRESLTNDFDDIAARVQFQINQIINDWHVNPLHAEMEFRRSFPSNKPGEDPMYELSTDSDGKMTFAFTESGKQLLKKRLTRNNRGQFDPIGSRRLRTNYGRLPRGARRSAPRVPRLIEAVK